MLLTFVCSGNTCRSPLALAAWSVAMREMGAECRAQLGAISVRCAGLNARAGTPATAGAQRVAASWRVDLSAHRAQIWRPSGAPDEIIVAMTREQAGQIRFRLGVRPEAGAPHIAVLGEIAHANAPDAPLWAPASLAWSEAPDGGRFSRDIPDPFGGSSEAYEECGKRILRGVRALTRDLCRD